MIPSFKNYPDSTSSEIGKTRDNYFSRNPRQWHFLQPLYPCSSVKWNSLSWLHSRHLFDSATSSLSKDSTSRLGSNLSYFSQILGFLQWICFTICTNVRQWQERGKWCHFNIDTVIGVIGLTITIETQKDQGVLSTNYFLIIIT